MCQILYMPWVERMIENANKAASESTLDSENPDIFCNENTIDYGVVEQLIYRGITYES
jgi:hypothetical protein